MSEFTKRQPRDGDTIISCDHIDGKVQFFYYPKGIKYRTNREARKAYWVVSCEKCLDQNGQLNFNNLNNISIWKGDDPIIKIDPRDN